MSQRRSLVDGLSDTPKVTELEKDFVFGEKAEVAAAEQKAPAPIEQPAMPQRKGLVSITTRCRPELASAIKRASLERQLAGLENSSIQDIVQQALEQWLAKTES
ncbi:MAG: hypothetical protein AAFX06_14220 [Planctomycetota bacterium]